MQGKTRKELKNITHIHIGKDKGRTEKQKPYSYRERQGKDKGRTKKQKPREGQGKDSEKQNPVLVSGRKKKEKKKEKEKHFVGLQ